MNGYSELCFFEFYRYDWNTLLIDFMTLMY